MVNLYNTVMTGVKNCFSVDFHMLTAGNNLKVARRIIKRISIYVMYLFFRGKFTPKHLFHYDSMFRLIMSVAHINIFITVLEIFKREYLFADRFSIPSLQCVVVSAKRFSPCRQRAAVYAAYWALVPIYSLDFERVTVFEPAFVMD